MSLRLRPYQDKLVNQTLKALGSHQRVMVQSPTGSGKTEVGLALSRHFLGSGYSVFWLTHRRELIRQTAQRAIINGLEVEVSYETGSYIEHRLNVQSIGKAQRRPLLAGAVVIVDEAHHATSPTWKRLLVGHVGPVVGLTATVWRYSKKEGFNMIFQHLVQGPSFSHLLDQGYMAPLRVNQLYLDLDPQNLKIRTRGGEYVEKDLLDQFKHNVIEAPIRVYDEQVKGKGRKVLVFTLNRTCAIHIAKHIAATERVGLLLSKPPDEAHEGILTDRDEIVKQFATSNLNVIVNVNILVEGFDVPAADCVIFARPTLSLVVWLQATGRATRPHPDDPTRPSLVYDLTGASRIHDLPQNDRQWRLGPRGPYAQRKGDRPLTVCSKCKTVNPLAARTCEGCNSPFGTVCSKCGQYRGWRSMPKRGASVCFFCLRDEQTNAISRPESFEDFFEELPPDQFVKRYKQFTAGQAWWLNRYLSQPPAPSTLGGYRASDPAEVNDKRGGLICVCAPPKSEITYWISQVEARHICETLRKERAQEDA